MSEITDTKFLRICTVKRFTVKRCRDNPGTLFVFGDNLLRKGKAGQAIIRDEPNAIGIPTKKKPTLYADAFFSDSEFRQNLAEIDHAVKILKAATKRPHIHEIAYPSDGIGTGLSYLPHKAPETYAALCEKLPGYKSVMEGTALGHVTHLTLDGDSEDDETECLASESE